LFGGVRVPSLVKPYEKFFVIGLFLAGIIIFGGI
jgi:hypothetical protein